MTNNDLVSELVNFDSDESMEEFLDILADSEVLKTVDLIAANPDVEDQLGKRGGIYIVSLKKIIIADREENEYFVTEVECEDFDELSEDALRTYLHVFDNKEEADACVKDEILKWKYAWGLRIL